MKKDQSPDTAPQLKRWGSRAKCLLRIAFSRAATSILGLRSRDVIADFPTDVWKYLLGKTFSLFICNLDWNSSRYSSTVQSHWSQRSKIAAGRVSLVSDPYRPLDELQIINHPEYLDILTDISYIPHLELPVVYSIRGYKGHTGGLCSGRDRTSPLVNIYEVFRRSKRTLQLDSDEIAVGLTLRTNYWHLVIDNLPRLVSTIDALVLHDPRLKPVIVVCSLPNSVQKSAVDILGLNVVYVPPHQLIEIQRFALYSSTWISPQNILRMRKVFMPAAAKTCGAPQPYIYIPRSTRALSNQNVLETWLASHGFVTTYLEQLSFTEQIAMFSTAKVIVGSHGAGMANMIWAPQGAVIIELATKTYWNGHIKILASLIGLGYSFVDVDTDNAEYGCGLKAILLLQEILGAEVLPSKE